MRDPMLHPSQALRRMQKCRIVSVGNVPDDQPSSLVNALSSPFIFNFAGHPTKEISKPLFPFFDAQTLPKTPSLAGTLVMQRQHVSALRDCNDRSTPIACDVQFVPNLGGTTTHLTEYLRTDRSTGLVSASFMKTCRSFRCAVYCGKLPWSQKNHYRQLVVRTIMLA